MATYLLAIYEQTSIFLVALFLALAVNGVAWRLKYYSYPPAAKKFTVKHLTGWDLAAAFFLYLGTSLILIPGFGALIWFLYGGGSGESETFTGWLHVLLVIVLLAGFGAYLYALQASKRHELFREWRHYKEHIAIGCVSWLICSPTVVVVGQVISLMITQFTQFEIVEQLSVQYLRKTLSSPSLFFATAASIVLAVPMIEELLFRGFLQTWLRKYCSVNGAIAATSLIFALFHFSMEQGIANIELVVSLFLLSNFLGFIYERQQSLLAPIALHVTFNAMTVFSIVNGA